jgi:hypothetical protein
MRRTDDGKGPQLVEVTPDRKVVWVLNDWANFGPATAVQILGDPGHSGKTGGIPALIRSHLYDAS